MFFQPEMDCKITLRIPSAKGDRPAVHYRATLRIFMASNEHATDHADQPLIDRINWARDCGFPVLAY